MGIEADNAFGKRAWKKNQLSESVIRSSLVKSKENKPKNLPYFTNKIAGS